MRRLSFKEYYDSKKKLLSACDTVPRIRAEYKVTKYCKLPVFESVQEDERVYVSLKPKDIIEILWEKANEFDDYPTVKGIILVSEDGKQVYPCWSNNKFHKWVESSTIET